MPLVPNPTTLYGGRRPERQDRLAQPHSPGTLFIFLPPLFRFRYLIYSIPRRLKPGKTWILHMYHNRIGTTPGEKLCECCLRF
jgi:hypothetical protein